LGLFSSLTFCAGEPSSSLYPDDDERIIVAF
jgi:hypothetical protein